MISNLHSILGWSVTPIGGTLLRMSRQLPCMQSQKNVSPACRWLSHPALCLPAGFEDSRTLARKMVKLYKLASEQLSQQDHYDFGMRAVKSVLVMAGSLRRANPELSEDVVLIRAMRDSNVPKFLAADLELFQNIISDLFPGVEVPYQVRHSHGLHKLCCQALQQVCSCSSPFENLL